MKWKKVLSVRRRSIICNDISPFEYLRINHLIAFQAFILQNLRAWMLQADRCAALSFTMLLRGFTINGLDEDLIQDSNTVLAGSNVYLKPTLHRCCFRFDPVLLDKSIQWKGEIHTPNTCYFAIKCSNLFQRPSHFQKMHLYLSKKRKRERKKYLKR